ncbi:hypothetical protein [Kutzneria buriramensis]|nr:hypothetical protein [Kutzneria buriramensis]
MARWLEQFTAAIETVPASTAAEAVTGDGDGAAPVVHTVGPVAAGSGEQSRTGALAARYAQALAAQSCDLAQAVAAQDRDVVGEIAAAVVVRQTMLTGLSDVPEMVIARAVVAAAAVVIYAVRALSAATRRRSRVTSTGLSSSSGTAPLTCSGARSSHAGRRCAQAPCVR